MLDSEPVVCKKETRRKKYPRVVRILKKSVEVTMIIKRILDLGVKLTVEEFLVLAPAVKKKLIKAIIEDKAIQFRVNSLDMDSDQETTAAYS